MFKDGVMEVSKDNEIAYSEVAKVSPKRRVRNPPPCPSP
jgi:hypothetical protein